MEKTVFASLLVFLATLSGISYHFLNEYFYQLPSSSDLALSIQQQQSVIKFMAKQVVSENEIAEAWLNWQTKFGKQFEIAEAPLRYQVFVDNYKYIKQHNSKKSSFKLGLNQFAYLTQEEFAGLQQGSVQNLNKENFSKITFSDSSNIAASLDWRSQGVVTSVKNQGQCGSCWAFASSAALEGLNVLNEGELQSFSTQQLVDCAGPVVGTKGCNGGNTILAFEYISQYGIESWDAYPYQQADQGSCQYDQSQVVFQNTNFSYLVNTEPSQIKIALNQQPLAIAIEANHYESGILDSSECGTNTDHQVTLIGYGIDASSGLYKKQLGELLGRLRIFTNCKLARIGRMWYESICFLAYPLNPFKLRLIIKTQCQQFLFENKIENYILKIICQLLCKLFTNACLIILI